MSVEGRIAALERSVEEVADVLMGPRRSIIAGGGRIEDLGLWAAVERLEESVAHILEVLEQKRMRTSMLVALIGGTSAVVSALVAKVF